MDFDGEKDKFNKKIRDLESQMRDLKVSKSG
jgi:hypothetical protein